MDASGDSKNDALSSSALLFEILGVLKRIDTRLELQDGKIRHLDSKITSATRGVDTTLSQIGRYRGIDDQASTNGPLRNPRTNSLPQTNATHRSELDLQKTPGNRINIGGSARSLVSDIFAEDNSEKWPHTRSSTLVAGTQKVINTSNALPESPRTGRINSIAKIATDHRMPTWGSHFPSPTTAEMDDGQRSVDNNTLISYSKYPPPQNWIITRSQGRALDVKYGTEEAKELWNNYIGDSWTIPPDGRIEMTFQQHILERLEQPQVISLLETLQDVSNRLEYRKESDFTKRGSFKVTDYDFDPNFEESIAEYRADIPIGQFRKHRVKGALRRSSLDYTPSAPWKRIIEVRGLSKKLIDGHEMWTSNFRDPWNEALPVVNPVCPFLTNRTADSSGNIYSKMRTIDEALLHHQQCWRHPPRCDDGLCFHVTFYELIDLSHENDLEGEIWRSGRLHSDNEEELGILFGVKSRKIRESACTIVMAADTDPAFSQYWTILYLCPNTFELYDKTDNFERYDTITTSIKGQDTEGAFTTMIEFSVRMIISRWEKIAAYFAWLVGHHRDTLSDPDAHDSLLFDDDSFSRSRRYFWAINYLAELDISISGNIVELEKFAKDNGLLRDQLSRLQQLRGQLRAQREDAIALRDGVSDYFSLSVKRFANMSAVNSHNEFELFSASGVMESRASTRLGENVKLLTFSIWSVNESFSLKTLLIVAVVVGLSTYIIVFNLNNVVRLCSRTYSRHKSRLVEQMKNDPDKNWNEKSKRLGSFKPKQENIKPSEWVMVLFILHKMFGGLIRKHASCSTTESSQAHDLSGNVTASISNWPDQPLPWEATEGSKTEQEPTAKAAEKEKKSSIRDGFSRLSIVFRRGALSATRSANV